MDFERTDHQFQRGDDIYFIDRNKTDLWKAKIKKCNEKYYAIHFEDVDKVDKKVKGTERLLERTEKNNQIYEAQLKQREELEKSMKEKEEEEENENPSHEEELDDENKTADKDLDTDSNKKKKRSGKLRSKRPIIDSREIVKNAWSMGFHEIEKFRKFLKKNLNNTMSEYEKYYKMVHVTENPYFKLGGQTSSTVENQFWEDCSIFWKRLCPNEAVVNTVQFIRKVSELLRLPNQTESNARDAIRFIFDPEIQPETEFMQFCAFMAMFGPAPTAMRKIGHFLKCPQNIMNSIVFNDMSELANTNIEDMEMNCFTLSLGEGKEKNVYNRVSVDTNGKYLVDADGVEYESWEELFEKYSE
ncbi:39 kDa initiator binding protein [Histomonas meleagridis]|uniref:39 kDa initiator binding protein n=1 Tax=Histomonas meleagridis TaxID=135588 RepID=UPI003559C36D|nr:39 kDa initiator binding protein [Histomonas meleagridis]KAH0797405.1 39 kDa initiator binding protein [Histomonas meleagridis]